jgi:hypothetical protein
MANNYRYLSNQAVRAEGHPGTKDARMLQNASFGRTPPASPGRRLVNAAMAIGRAMANFGPPSHPAFLRIGLNRLGRNGARGPVAAVGDE